MGSDSLPAGSCHLIDSNSFDALKQESLDVKRLWLQAVRVARATFTDMLVDPGTVLTAQAIRFRSWFVSPLTPSTTLSLDLETLRLGCVVVGSCSVFYILYSHS